MSRPPCCQGHHCLVVITSAGMRVVHPFSRIQFIASGLVWKHAKWDSGPVPHPGLLSGRSSHIAILGRLGYTSTVSAPAVVGHPGFPGSHSSIRPSVRHGLDSFADVVGIPVGHISIFFAKKLQKFMISRERIAGVRRCHCQVITYHHRLCHLLYFAQSCVSVPYP